MNEREREELAARLTEVRDRLEVIGQSSQAMREERAQIAEQIEELDEIILGLRRTRVEISYLGDCD